MPLMPDTARRPPFWLRNGHLQTVWPVLFRKAPQVPFQRERIATPDGDFLDLDWLLQKEAHRLAILTHGLEGSSRQPYIAGMAQALFNSGWNVLAWNFRGCSGTANRLLRSYHSGAVEDLQCVIDHAIAHFCKSSEMLSGRTSGKNGHHLCGDSATPSPASPQPSKSGNEDASASANQPAASAGSESNPAAPPLASAPAIEIALIGFSLGGNLVLKYAGDCGLAAKQKNAGNRQSASEHEICQTPLRIAITHAVGISVPCDLQGSTQRLELRRNRFYMERFLKTLRVKIREKKAQFPDALDDRGLDAIRTFREFDDRYTAPLHGFRDAEEYWYKCSCLRNLEHVAVPTLILNAADDPFLSEGCYPRAIAEKHPLLHLEIPRNGGHVGFVLGNGRYYSEERVAAFLND